MKTYIFDSAWRRRFIWTIHAVAPDIVSRIPGYLQGASEFIVPLDLPSAACMFLRVAVRCRSRKVLQYLLKEYGEFIQEIEPDDLVTLERIDRAPVISLPPVQLLQYLFDHGWDIHRAGTPNSVSGPLLWRVCPSLELVQWCLDHDAKPVIPDEVISRDPNVADVFHTPRHPLLLEVVASFGDVATFEKLHAAGAPLTPGYNWPENQAPLILYAAVYSAARLDWGTDEPGSKFDTRMQMIKFLVNTMKLDVNRVGGIHLKSMIKARYYHPPSTSKQKPSKRSEISKITHFLLDNGADIEFALSFPDDERATTPLGCLQCTDAKSFESAVQIWRAQQVTKLPVRIHTPIRIAGMAWKNAADTTLLSDMPQDILRIVGDYLGLVDIRNLRLTNRSVSAGVFGNFRRFLQRRYVRLNPYALDRLTKELEYNPLASFIDEIVLSTACILKADSVYQSLLRLISELCSINKLRSIAVSMATKSELTNILRVIDSVKPQLQALSFYHGAGQHIGPVEYFIDSLSSMNLVPILSSIRKFTWSIGPTNPVVKGLQPDDPKIIATIKQILSLLPSVNVLELLWYRTEESRLSKDSQFFDSCFTAVLAMNLKECTLTGLYMRDDTLHKFLANTSAKRVSLVYIFLTLGNYTAILDTLSSGKFYYFHLDGLHESGSTKFERVCFDVPDKGRYYPRSFEYMTGPDHITREGREATKKITYRTTKQILGGNKYMYHLVEMKEKCGYSEVWEHTEDSVYWAWHD